MDRKNFGVIRCEYTSLHVNVIQCVTGKWTGKYVVSSTAWVYLLIFVNVIQCIQYVSLYHVWQESGQENLLLVLRSEYTCYTVYDRKVDRKAVMSSTAWVYIQIYTYKVFDRKVDRNIFHEFYCMRMYEPMHFWQDYGQENLLWVLLHEYSCKMNRKICDEFYCMSMRGKWTGKSAMSFITLTMFCHVIIKLKMHSYF